MASVLIKLSLGVIFLPGVFGGCAKAQVVSNQDRPKIETPSNLDLSTNEAVLAELQRIADAKLEALGKTAGRKLEARFVCIKRLKESAEIIVIGGFAYDRGCRFQGVFVNSRYFEKDDAALSKNALAALGWEKAPKREREMLAKFWVEQGLVPFFTVLYTKDKELNDTRFNRRKSFQQKAAKSKLRSGCVCLEDARHKAINTSNTDLAGTAICWEARRLLIC